MGPRSERAADEDDATDVEQREVECAGEDDAKAEVTRQQIAEPDDRAEWIYLHNASGAWVARRVGRYPAPQKPVSLKQAAKEEAAALLDPLEWPWLFVP